MQHYDQIRELIDRVRARWRALCALRAVVRGALSRRRIIGAAVLASRWTTGAPVALMLLAAARAAGGGRHPGLVPGAAAARPRGRARWRASSRSGRRRSTIGW